MQLVGSLCKRHAVVPHRTPTACKRTVSGSISLPCSGCFPPFPHGTGPLSVFRECLALRDGPRDFGQDSSCPALLRITDSYEYVYLYGTVTLCGRCFHSVPVSSPSDYSGPMTPHGPQTARFRLCPFRSPLLRVSIFSFSSSGY